MLTIERKVHVSLTANQWQIFSDMPGANIAAVQMSKLAGKALSQRNKEEALDMWFMGVEEFLNFGGCDTEPRNVFYDLLDEVFGD